MTCETACSNCNGTGLPILFTRYAAAYSPHPDSIKELNKLAPVAPLENKPGDVDLKTAIYGLRMLRTGYLYVRYTSPAHRAPQWLGYAVHPHGYLTPFTVSQPETAKAIVPCARDARQANNCLVWIPGVEKVTGLHYMFHPSVIQYKHLMGEIEPKLDQYMQKLNVAAWVTGQTKQKHTCTPDNLATQLPEFAGLKSEKVRDAFEGQFFGLMGCDPFERGWGDWEEAVEFDEEIAVGSAGSIMAPTGRTKSIIVNRKGPSYDQVHRQRLEQMVEFLQKNKGVVAACADPIGIAQTLSMSLPMAAVPYELWMSSAPDKPLTDFPKLSNGWLASTAGSVEQMLGAMKQGLTESQQAKLQSLKEQRKLISDGEIHFLGRKERQPDGTEQFVSPDQERAELLAEWDARIAKQQKDIDEGKAVDPKKTLEEAKKLFAQSKIDDFNKLYEPQKEELDKRLDELSNDLIAWLDAAAMQGVLARYNGKDCDQGGDGEQFAVHLSVALLNLDSSNTGRRYLGKQNSFVYARNNLVSRVIGCNSAAVSNEVHQACEKLDFSAAANTNAAQPRDLDAERLRQLDAVIKVVAASGKVMKSTEKMNKLYDKPSKTTTDKLAAVTNVHAAIKAAAGAGWPSVLFAAATLFAARAGGSEKEKTLLGAKALAYAQGLGSDAHKLLQAEKEELVKKIATNKRLNKVRVAGPREWKEQATSLQRRLDKAVQGSATTSVVGKMRVSGLLLIADALGTLVGGTAKASIKMDARTALETSGQYLALVGTFRNLRTTLCEEMVFKSVVTVGKDSVITVAPFAQATHLDKVTTKQLLKFRQAAGRFTIAGSSVLVGLDVFDGWRAYGDQKKALTTAYWSRAAGGGFTIAGVGVGMFSTVRATLAANLTLVGIILTASSTVFIEILKPKLWQDWFRAQPFRTDKDNTDGSWSQWFEKPSPHKSAAQMLSKLDEAMDDAKQGD